MLFILPVLTPCFWYFNDLELSRNQKSDILNCHCNYLKRFKKFGKFSQTDSESTVVEYTKDSVRFKILVQNCSIIYSSSEHIYSKASSWAKFENNCIVFYDTLDGDGKILKSYIRGLPEFENKEMLSSELIEFFCE